MAKDSFSERIDFSDHPVTAVYDALEREMRRIDALRTADQVALSAALLAAKTAVDAALAAAEKAVAAALIAAKEAVNKAEIAQAKTNEGQNEFRGQLRDQANTFLPKNEFILTNQNNIERLEDLRKDLGNVRSRIDIGPPSLSTLQSESDRRGGRDTGTGDTWKIVAVIASAVVGFAGLVLALLQFRP